MPAEATQPERAAALQAPIATPSAAPPPPGLRATAELFRAAGHPLRLRILYLLQHETEIHVTHLAEALEVSVSTASRHARLLRPHRLLEPRREGVSVYYRLTDHPFHEVLRSFLFDAATDDSRG